MLKFIGIYIKINKKSKLNSVKKDNNRLLIRKATIYYASGTGNSYRVARWFEDFCHTRGISTRFSSVNKANTRKDIISSRDNLLVITFPTHGLMPPWSVIKFLFKMPCRKKTKFLCIPTRGSFFIGPLLVPGAAGLASYIPSIILFFRGFHSLGAVSFDMPVNMTSIHPPLSTNHSRRIVAAAKNKFNKYLNRLFRKGSLWFTRNNLWEILWSIALLYFFPLFPILYLLIGRFFMGKIIFSNHLCIGCGICADICPTEAIIMKGIKKKYPYWSYHCEACLRCLNFCPQKAITVGHSWAVLLWIIAASLAFGAALYTWLSGYFPFLNHIRNWWTVELLNVLFYYPVICLSYFLFFHLIRIKPINFLFNYFSFSPLFKQYKEPDTTLHDWQNQQKGNQNNPS